MLGLGLSIPQIAVLGAGRPRWLVPGPDGALPVQVSAWSDNAGFVGGRVHASAAAYLAAAGGTFSRASDAWRRDVDRIWRKSGSNALRLHHDAAGKPLGALLEGPRTFSLFPSRNFTGADWIKRGTCTVTQDMATARPDGTPGAMRIAGIHNGGSDDIYCSLGTGPVSQAAAVDLMLRRVSTSGTAFLSNPYGSSLGRWQINLALLPDAWELVARTHPAVTVVNEFSSSAGGGFGLQLSASSGGPLTVFADFANVEFAGGVLWPSSPMDPSTGAVTRLADALSYPVTLPSEFTVVVTARSAPDRDTFQTLLILGDGTLNNRIMLYRNTARMVSLAVYIAGSVLSDGATAVPLPDDTPVRIALSYKSGTYRISSNGSAAETISAGLPTVTTILEGMRPGGTNQWFGTSARTEIYSKAYSALELPGMSAP